MLLYRSDGAEAKPEAEERSIWFERSENRVWCLRNEVGSWEIITCCQPPLANNILLWFRENR